MNPDSRQEDKKDHGQVVKNHERTIAWFWIFPVLAALATGWLFYSNWASKGPGIEIIFDEAPGIEAGKTSLFYRGVNSGTVESVRVLKDLKSVAVRIRLEGFASGLASRDTKFWIDRPVVSVTELTGLESIIRGNSIQAGTPGGESCYQFKGHTKPPIISPDTVAFSVWVDGTEIAFLNRGTPVYHRGVRVGVVCQKDLAPDGRATLQLSIDPAYQATIRENSRFWAVPWTSVSLGQGGMTINVPGVDALLHGGLAYDHFDNPGKPVAEDARFSFHNTEAAARASGPVLTVNFQEARGIRPGNTPVCYLGHPIGLVESLVADPANQTVRASVRLQPEFQNLATSSAAFTLIQPQLSIQGVANLDTLVSGPYLELDPGSGGEPTTQFAGRTIGDREWQQVRTQRDGLRVRLTADNLPNIDRGSPVYHRGVVVGTVLEKILDSKNKPALEIAIRPEFRASLASNARFWRVPATSVKAGPGVLQVDIQGLESLVNGGVAFDVFASPAKQASNGDSFRLFSDEQTARASSAPVRIRFDNGRGLVAGSSQVRYLGVPVGIVESVEPKDGYIFVIARLDEGYEYLRREGSLFSVVRPNISLQGITGLETLVSGVYIEVVPGASKKLADSFVGIATAITDSVLPTGLNLRLTATNSQINVGAPILYKGIPVGQVTEKNLSSDGREVVFRAVIDRKFDQLVHSKSCFWDSSGLKASVGILKFRIQTESALAPAGQISFATPEGSAMGPRAKDGENFTLFPTHKPEWLNWNPSIPED
ncbi:MAG: MlaD family protein [Spartobacteria bacterium]